MADLIYERVMEDLEEKIKQNSFPDMKLPDERTLSNDYKVSRVSIKHALNHLADRGIVFKKRGAGTFVNPIYLKKPAFFNYEGDNLGITDSVLANGKSTSIELLGFKVIRPSKEIQESLFIKEDEFVYEIKRLRLLDEKPFMIEVGYIPIKLVPGFNEIDAKKSIFNYVEEEYNQIINKSFMTISVAPSNNEDQKLLNLKANEPVGLMDGIFFLNNGTPFEYSTMRVHYEYMKYNTFIQN